MKSRSIPLFEVGVQGLQFWVGFPLPFPKSRKGGHKKDKWTWEIVQLVRTEFDYQSPCKKRLGVVSHTCNPSAGETKMGDFRGLPGP